MADYEPNSYKYLAQKKDGKTESNEKPERKKLEKVISGTATTRKKGAVTKLAEVFLQEDIADVKTYIRDDVLIPSVKKMLLGVVEGFLYPGGSKPSNGIPGSKVSYNRYYAKPAQRETRQSTIYRTSDYEDVTVESRGDAEAVIMRMNEQIDSYGFVTVGDLYDFVGIQGTNTDFNYGWTDIRYAAPIRVRNGYQIKLPKPLPID